VTRDSNSRPEPAQNEGSTVVTEEDRRRDTYSPAEKATDDQRVLVTNVR
jgi:hypothetical protein